MPKLVRSVPAYRHHRPSGQAVVTIQGRDVYLGPWKSKASRVEYDRLIGEWLAAGRQAGSPQVNGHDLTVNELVLKYWRHAEQHYQKGGQPTDELASIRAALKHLRLIYGATPARSFGPLALSAIRHRLIEAGGSRGYINGLVARIRRAFRWAASQELVPVQAYQALATLQGLQPGKSAARDTAPIGPVSIADFEATLPFVPVVAADLLRFQLLAGCRPGEAIAIRTADVDRSESVWVYSPRQHKTEHRGFTRKIFIGPQAQEILLSYLDDARPELFCFRPKNRTGHRAEKYTVRTLHHAVRRACARRAGLPFPKRPAAAADASTWDAYRAAVEIFNQKLAAASWAPNQLRHTAATAIRRRYGLEAASVVLGHAGLAITQVYAERDFALAARVAGEAG